MHPLLPPPPCRACAPTPTRTPTAPRRARPSRTPSAAATGAPSATCACSGQREKRAFCPVAPNPEFINLRLSLGSRSFLLAKGDIYQYNPYGAVSFNDMLKLKPLHWNFEALNHTFKQPRFQGKSPAIMIGGVNPPPYNSVCPRVCFYFFHYSRYFLYQNLFPLYFRPRSLLPLPQVVQLPPRPRRPRGDAAARGRVRPGLRLREREQQGKKEERGRKTITRVRPYGPLEFLPFFLSSLFHWSGTNSTFAL